LESEWSWTHTDLKKGRVSCRHSGIQAY
jgi:hypothetical protein